MPKIPLSKGPIPPMQAAGGHVWHIFDTPILVATADQIARESMRASEIKIIGGLCYALRGGVYYVSPDLTGGYSGG